MKKITITFKDIIDKKTTIKKFKDNGIAEVIHKNIPLVFEEEQSLQEIKNRSKRILQKKELWMIISWFAISGFVIGMGVSIVMNSMIQGLISFESMIMLFLMLGISLIFFTWIRHTIRKWRKWIYFPTDKSMTIIGIDSDDQIKQLKENVVFLK